MAESGRDSRVPTLLGFVALSVLAIAFAAALAGSLLASRWKDAQRRADIVEESLRETTSTFEQARNLSARHRRISSELGPRQAQGSTALVELRQLVSRADLLQQPPRPQLEGERSPTRAQLAELEDWLDVGYQRLAAAADIEARLGVVADEIAGLERAASGLEQGSRAHPAQQGGGAVDGEHQEEGRGEQVQEGS